MDCIPRLSQPVILQLGPGELEGLAVSRGLSPLAWELGSGSTSRAHSSTRGTLVRGVQALHPRQALVPLLGQPAKGAGWGGSRVGHLCIRKWTDAPSPSQVATEQLQGRVRGILGRERLA